LHTLLAIAWLAAIHASGAPFPWWLTPIIGGLLLAIPMSVLGSRASLGRAWKRAGLLLIPEEIDPPAVLVAARRHAAALAQRTVDFDAAVLDADVHARVRAAACAHAPAKGAKAAATDLRLAKVREAGLEVLGNEERLRLLSDRTALTQMRAVLVDRRTPRLPPDDPTPRVGASLPGRREAPRTRIPQPAPEATAGRAVR